MDLDAQLKAPEPSSEEYASNNIKQKVTEKAETKGEGDGKKTVSMGRHERLLSAERARADAAEKRLDEMNSELKRLKESAAERKILESELKCIKSESKAAKEEYEKSLVERSKIHAIESELYKRGCVDVTAVMAHIDQEEVSLEDEELTNVDFDAMTKDLAYLFSETPKGSTGGAVEAPAKEDEEQERKEYLARVKG